MRKLLIALGLVFALCFGMTACSTESAATIIGYQDGYDSCVEYYDYGAYDPHSYYANPYLVGSFADYDYEGGYDWGYGDCMAGYPSVY